MDLTKELKEILYSQGADLVGIGDMRGVENCRFKAGYQLLLHCLRK